MILHAKNPFWYLISLSRSLFQGPAPGSCGPQDYGGRRWHGIHVCPLGLWCPLLRVSSLVWSFIHNHWGKWPSALAECPSGPVSGAQCPNSQTPISEFRKHVMAFSFWSSASMHPMAPQQLSIPSVGFRCLRPLHVTYMQGEPRVLLFWALPVSISTHQAHSRLDGNLPKGWGVLSYC